MAVRVHLLPFNQTFALSKDFITTFLPKSVLADALELDPEAMEIPISNTAVTPEALSLLTQLAAGQEPNHHVPRLLTAHQYLNIPGILYYADPHYDEIPNRANPNAPENAAFIQRALKEDLVWAYGYLLQKGLVPTWEQLRTAIMSGSVEIVRLLIRDPRLNLTAMAPYVEFKSTDTQLLPREENEKNTYANRALNLALRHGRNTVVQLLLQDPQVDPGSNAGYPLFVAGLRGNSEGLRLLLDDPRVVPINRQLERTLTSIVLSQQLDTLRLLLTHPKSCQLAPSQADFSLAVMADALPIVRGILEDGRFDPTNSLREVIRNNKPEIVRLLLQDPRVSVMGLPLPATIYVNNIQEALGQNNPELIRAFLETPRAVEEIRRSPPTVIMLRNAGYRF